jgi:hypothetical protein
MAEKKTQSRIRERSRKPNGITFAHQRLQLRRSGVHLCQIGHVVGRKAMQDEEIIPLLKTLRSPTFIAWDRAFFEKSLGSDRFCLVYCDVRAQEVAVYTRRLLRRPEFKTWSQRQGRAIRVLPKGISVRRIREPRMSRHR